MSDETKRGRKRREERPVYPIPFDFRRPGDAAADIEFAKSLAAGKKPSPNKGVISATAFGQAFKACQLAANAGDPIPSMPGVYSPIRRQAAADLNGICVFTGQKGEQPKSGEVPESMSAKWGEKDRINRNSKGVPEPLRLCHKRDVRDLVIDRANNVLTINQHDFVVGSVVDNAIETPAALLINGSSVGNYGMNIICGKRLSFEGNDDINSLVARINNNYAIVQMDDGTVPGMQVAFSPNQVVDAWGYFERGGKRMTPQMIRKAVADGKTDDMTFVPLESPIVGKAVTRSAWWTLVKREMSKAGTKRGEGDESRTLAERFGDRKGRNGESGDMAERAWTNLKVQCRTSPGEQMPFGFFNVQTKIAPCPAYGDDLNTEVIRFVIGAYIGAEWSENRWAARARLNPVTASVETASTETKTETKSKATKKKSTKKVAKKSKNQSAAENQSAADDSSQQTGDEESAVVVEDQPALEQSEQLENEAAPVVESDATAHESQVAEPDESESDFDDDSDDADDADTRDLDDASDDAIADESKEAFTS